MASAVILLDVIIVLSFKDENSIDNFLNLETLKLTKTFPQNIKGYDCIYNASEQLAHILHFLIWIGKGTFKDTHKIGVQLTWP